MHRKARDGHTIVEVELPKEQWSYVKRLARVRKQTKDELVSQLLDEGIKALDAQGILQPFDFQ